MGKKKTKKASKPNKRNQKDSSSPNQKKTQRKVSYPLHPCPLMNATHHPRSHSDRTLSTTILQGNKKNGRCQTFDDLSTELSQHGLRVKIVAADGSCFFRSLADQLEGDNGDHLHYRTKVVDYIQQHEDNFKPFIEDDESLNDYITRMRRDGTWAGNIELQAASMALHVNFRIYQPGQPVWTIKNWPDHIGEASPSSSQYNDNDEGVGSSSSSSSRKGKKGGKKSSKSSLLEPSKTLHMAYHDGCHYNSVRAADDHGSGPPLPINAVLFDMHKEEEEDGGDDDTDEDGGSDSDSDSDSEEEEPSSPGGKDGSKKKRKKKSYSNCEASTAPAPAPAPAPSNSTNKTSTAPGRNRQCPCGSKMKYKNCCGTTKRVAAVVNNQVSSDDKGGGDGKKVNGVTVRLKELLI
jgi:OTU domain-containing protein 3